MSWFNQLSPEAQAALISAVVAVVTLLVSTPLRHWWDRKFLRFKLRVEYEYEQRKRLREMIGRYDGRILEAAVSLNYRFWNLYKNVGEGWLDIHGDYANKENYYFQSSVCRFLHFCSLVLRFEREAQFIDSRIAEKADLDFLRYAKAFIWAATDADLFAGLGYDPFRPIDHFFRDELKVATDSCCDGDEFTSFRDFRAGIRKNRDLRDVLQFFDGLRPDEDRLRWNRVVALDLLIMAFINSFGYKWQKSTSKEFATTAGRICHPEIVMNLVSWLPKLGLDGERSIKQMLAAIRASAGKG